MNGRLSAKASEGEEAVGTVKTLPVFYAAAPHFAIVDFFEFRMFCNQSWQVLLTVLKICVIQYMRDSCTYQA